MRFRKFLDARYAAGRADGAAGRRRDPANCGEPGANVEPYARWAYDAGHRQGLYEFEQLRLRLTASNTNVEATPSGSIIDHNHDIEGWTRENHDRLHPTCAVMYGSAQSGSSTADHLQGFPASNEGAE